MKKKYCWRCKIEVPFLDEKEFEEIRELYGKCIRLTKDRRKQTGTSIVESPIDKFFSPVREAYERITGYKNMHHNAIMHHRLSLLGQNCHSCGKPLRTPKAKLCPLCGWEGDV